MIRSVLLALAAALPVAAQQSNGAERPVAGAYTEAQATLGEEVFQATCSACHVPSDHTGEQFKMNWYGRTVWDYFVKLKKTMPDDNPGGLSDGEYLRVTAYILKLNGYAAGADSLAADSVSLSLVRIGPPPPDTVKPRTRR